MTANVTFEIARSAADALRVPVSAHPQKPPPELLDPPKTARPDAAHAESKADAKSDARPDARGEARTDRPRGPKLGDGAAGGRSDGAGGKPGGGGRGRRRETVVYVVTPANLLRPIAVRPGISDGTLNAIEPVEKDAIGDGLEVVTAILHEEEEAATNPFAPKFPGGQRGQGGGGRGR
jgi:hypothetical protein